MIIKGELSKRRRARDSWTIEVVSIEIPILPTETQEPVGNLPMETTVIQEPAETQGESSKRRRTKVSWETEVASIEIPILRPRLPTETQEPVGNLPTEATVTQETVQLQLEFL